MKRWFQRFLVFLACGSTLAATGTFNVTKEPSKHDGVNMVPMPTVGPMQPPRVLIDQSHDFLFIVLHLGTFLKTHGFMGTFSHATLAPRIYRNCDVIVTHQSGSDVPYTKRQVSDLKKFVSKGGGLLLIGYGPAYVGYAKSKNLTFESWPMNLLAGELGFHFEPEAGRLPLAVQTHTLTEGIREVTFQDKNPRVGIVSVPKEASVLLADSTGKPVLAVREFGNGRVAVLTEYRFIKTIDEPPNERLFVNLFGWLGANSANKVKMANRRPQEIFPGIELHKGHDYELVDKPEPPEWDGGPDFIWPEIQVKRGAIMLQYSASMKARAEYLIQQYPVVYNTIYELFQVEPAQEMILEALPSSGGGYHWTKQRLVAIGALADDKAVVGIMGHEMVHAWGLPTPRNFPHGWTAFTDDYLSAKLQLRTPAEMTEEWNRELSELKALDPNLDSLDIVEATTDPTRQRLLDKKVGWILKELEKKYGLDFFARLVRIYREQGKTPRREETYEGLPMDDFVYYASLAAGEDLYPWFRSLGTTVHPRPLQFQHAAPRGQ